MAEILKARDLDRPGGPLLAVKRILPHLTEDPQYVTMFLDESRVLAQLSHGNIIRTFDVGQVGPTPYLALEYVHGHDARMLFHRCRREGQPMPLRVACFAMAEVCAGLHFAHEQLDAQGNLLGIVHRDVSLQNILLSYAGDVKLIDFGIAMSAANMARTEVGIVKGKFGYMSPEQVKGEPLDRRSDVFAAGICLYEMLTGERLFSGDNDYAAVDKVRNVRIEPPSRLNRQIPSALEALVMKSLAKSPRDRFQSAADMRRALMSFMSESGNTCTPEQLAELMRKIFSDEIGEPASSDTSATTVMPEESASGRPGPRKDALTGLAAFDDLEPVSALTALDRSVAPPPAAPSPRVAPVSQALRPSQRPTPSVQAGLAEPLAFGSDSQRAPEPPTLPGLAAQQAAQAAQAARLPSEPPTSDLHLLDQQSAPVDMDWDEDEPITQHESVRNLPKHLPDEEAEEVDALEPEPQEIGDEDQTRQMYLGETFSGVVPRGSGIQRALAPGSLPAPAPVPQPQPFGYAPPPETQVIATSTSTPPARVSYAVVVAVVATIVGVISVGLMATRSSRPASIHLSTLPTDSVVRVDDRPTRLERSPFLIGDLEPEVVHQLDVTHEGYEPWSTRITLQPGQVLKLPRVALVPTSNVHAAQPERPIAVPAPQPAPAPNDETRSPTSAGAAAKRDKLRAELTLVPKPKPRTELPVAQHEVEARPPAPTTQEPKVATPEPEPAAPAAASDPSGNGILRINSRPWSQVLVDGRVVGNTPQMNIALPAGTHTVTLVNSQFGHTKTLRIKIKAGEVITKIVDLP